MPPLSAPSLLGVGSGLPRFSPKGSSPVHSGTSLNNKRTASVFQEITNLSDESGDRQASTPTATTADKLRGHISRWKRARLQSGTEPRDKPYVRFGHLEDLKQGTEDVLDAMDTMAEVNKGSGTAGWHQFSRDVPSKEKAGHQEERSQPQGRTNYGFDETHIPLSSNKELGRKLRPRAVSGVVPEFRRAISASEEVEVVKDRGDTPRSSTADKGTQTLLPFSFNATGEMGNFQASKPVTENLFNGRVTPSGQSLNKPIRPRTRGAEFVGGIPTVPATDPSVRSRATPAWQTQSSRGRVSRPATAELFGGPSTPSGQSVGKPMRKPRTGGAEFVDDIPTAVLDPRGRARATPAWQTRGAGDIDNSAQPVSGPPRTEALTTATTGSDNSLASSMFTLKSKANIVPVTRGRENVPSAPANNVVTNRTGATVSFAKTVSAGPSSATRKPPQGPVSVQATGARPPPPSSTAKAVKPAEAEQEGKPLPARLLRQQRALAARLANDLSIGVRPGSNCGR